MTLEEKDLILRTIAQLARFLAAALRRALALKAQGQEDAALEECATACRELFGLDARLLHLMDVETLSRALGHPERVRLFADLLETEAALREARDPGRARLLRDHALGLLARAGTPRA